MKILNTIRRCINGNIGDKLKIIHWNLGAKLWTNKLVEIELLLSEKQPDLCFLSEANLWSYMEDHEVSIPGHNIILPNTMKHLKHARIVLVAKDHLNIHKLNQYMDKDTATIWVRIGESKKNSIVIGGVYRQHLLLEDQDPQNTWVDKQERQEERWTRVVDQWRRAGANKNCIVLGDLNLDYLRWQNQSQSHMRMTEMIQEDIETIGFVQLLTSHTRTGVNQADSLIDHVWTNRSDRVLSYFNDIRGDSDHNLIGLDVSKKDIKTGGFIIRRRAWNNFSEARFVQTIKDIDWTDVLEDSNIDTANSRVEERLRDVLNLEAPMINIQMRTRYNKWISPETKQEMLLRDGAKEKARLSQLEVDWIAYRVRRNKCTSLQKLDKSRFLRDTFTRLETERDASAIHATARDILGSRKAGPPTTFLIEGRTIRKQTELANAQQNYYVSKIGSIRNSLPRVRNNPLRYLEHLFARWTPLGEKPQFRIKSVTTVEVFKMLKNLKKSHAFGRDELDAASIKIVAPILAPIFAHLVNLSLGTARFPMKWKMSRIVPLLKSPESERTNPASFQPVSQLPLISKLAERAVQVQILKYLEETGQLSPNHHAYRTGTSTTSALIQISDIIAAGGDSNEITETMTTDLSAAFDSVEHGLLLQKLRYYGLDNHTMKWIESYLTSRSSYVVVGSGNSTIKTTFFGVPQGSCLGPLLYLIFINELPSVVNEDYCGEDCHQITTELFTKDCKKCGYLPVFADDAQYMITNTRRRLNQDRIEEVFTKLKNYFEDNGLQINATKTSITEHMTRQKRTKIGGTPTDLTVTEKIKTKDGKIQIHDKLITDKTNYRYLGLNFSNNGLWDPHVDTGTKPLLQSL